MSEITDLSHIHVTGTKGRGCGEEQEGRIAISEKRVFS